MIYNQKDLAETLCRAAVRRNVPGISAAIHYRGQSVAAAIGVVNTDTNVGMTPQAVMHIGSITKVFTATLVMQLVDEGLIALDDPILRHVPDLVLRDRAALGRITIRMLLNHTSGIDGDMLPECGHDLETIEDGIRRFADLDFSHEPGTEFSYCNAGSVIAGYLVQCVRKKSWYDTVRHRIFSPLGMHHAAVLPEEALLHRASVGHFLRKHEGDMPRRTECAFLPLSFAPAGATIMMSASDLVTFGVAHLENDPRLLSSSAFTLMRTSSVDTRARRYTYAAGMGLGWMLTEDGSIFHAGGGPGIVAALYMSPDKGWVAAILTNAAHGFGAINDLLGPWLDAIGKKNPFSPDVIIPQAPSQQICDDSRYVGVYRGIAETYQVTAGEEGLLLRVWANFSRYKYVSTEPSPDLQMRFLGDDEFLIADEKPGDGSPGFLRILTFKNPDVHGRMQHLGYGHKLFKRSAAQRAN